MEGRPTAQTHGGKRIEIKSDVTILGGAIQETLSEAVANKDTASHWKVDRLCEHTGASASRSKAT